MVLSDFRDGNPEIPSQYGQHFISAFIFFPPFPSWDSDREGGGVLLQVRKWVSPWQVPRCAGTLFSPL